MRYYKFADPIFDEEGRCIGDNIQVFSEEQILSMYWDYWSNEVSIVNPQIELTKENCISDWVVVNWAWECDKDGKGIIQE